MIKRSWLIGTVLFLISIFLLVFPTLNYVFSHEETFFITGYLGTRELYTTDEQEIQSILIEDYPEAVEGDFIRLVDTDTDWDYKNGVWTNYEHLHAYLTTDDILFSVVIVLIILGLVMLKVLKNMDKMLSFPIWLALLGFLSMFIKGILVYLPNILFNVAIGWALFYVFYKMSRRQFEIWKEYRNEKVRVIARSE